MVRSAGDDNGGPVAASRYDVPGARHGGALGNVCAVRDRASAASASCSDSSALCVHPQEGISVCRLTQAAMTDALCTVHQRYSAGL